MRTGDLIIAVAGQGERSGQPRERWLLTFLRRQIHVLRGGNRQRAEWNDRQTILTNRLRHERRALSLRSGGNSTSRRQRGRPLTLGHNFAFFSLQSKTATGLTRFTIQ